MYTKSNSNSRVSTSGTKSRDPDRMTNNGFRLIGPIGISASALSFRGLLGIILFGNSTHSRLIEPLKQHECDVSTRGETIPACNWHPVDGLDYLMASGIIPPHVRFKGRNSGGLKRHHYWTSFKEQRSVCAKCECRTKGSLKAHFRTRHRVRAPVQLSMIGFGRCVEASLRYLGLENVTRTLQIEGTNDELRHRCGNNPWIGERVELGSQVCHLSDT